VPFARRQGVFQTALVILLLKNRKKMVCDAVKCGITESGLEAEGETCDVRPQLDPAELWATIRAKAGRGMGCARQV
jgi:hypothetical protein